MSPRGLRGWTDYLGITRSRTAPTPWWTFVLVAAVCIALVLVLTPG